MVPVELIDLAVRAVAHIARACLAQIGVRDLRKIAGPVKIRGEFVGQGFDMQEALLALPVSIAVSRANSSVRCSSSSAILLRARDRSVKCRARQARKASCAAFTARSRSAVPADGTRAMTVSRLAGFLTSHHSPVSDSTS